MKKILEEIEQRIERLEPSVVVRVSDLTKRLKSSNRTDEVTDATIMLLKKYGIEYLKE